MAFINFVDFSGGGGGGDASAITQDFTSTIERTVSSLTLPSGTTTIGENAFASCSALTEVTIPAGVQTIEANAFAENRSLQTINFEGTTPPSVASDAFSQLPSSVTVNVPEGSEDAYSAITEDIEDSTAMIIEYTDLSGNTVVWYSKKPQVAWNDGTNEQPPMPDGGWAKIETKGIVSLDDNCFLNEMAVEYVFGDSVKESHCTPIRGENPYSTPTKVTYKSTSFDYFDGRICENGFNISSITFYCPTAPSIINDGYINSSHTANYGELFIPNGAKDYKGWKNFYCGEDWVTKDLSGNTMNLEMHYTDRNGWSGEYQFYGFIPSYFFVNNSELVEVVLPDAANDLKTGTFRGCVELTAVTIPSTCWRIQPQVFKDCVWLSDITCYATTAPSIETRIGDESFGNVSPQGTLNIPTCASGYDAWLAQLGSGWTINEMGGGGASGTFDLVNNCANYGSGKTDILDFYIPLSSSATPTLDFVFGSAVGADGLTTEIRKANAGIQVDYVPENGALRSGNIIYDITQHSWLYSDSSVYENHPDADCEADLQTLDLFFWEEQEINGETYLLISMNSGESYATMADLTEWGLYDEEVDFSVEVVSANNEIYTYYQ